MRRALKWFAGGIAALILILVLLMGGALLLANTDAGRRVIEALVPRFTHDMVRVEGLAGRFPDAIRVRRVTIADANGVWLTVTRAALDWSPRGLITGTVSIGRLAAEAVAVDRLPAREASNGSIGGALPAFEVKLAHFRVARLEVGSAVAGRNLVLAGDGAAAFVAPDTGEAHIAVTSLEPHAGSARDREAPALDHYTLELSMDRSHIHADLDVAEGARGLLTGLAQLPDLGAITIGASADGPIDGLATRATIEAGPLRASLNGTVDVASRAMDLVFSVMAPAMEPRPGLGWSSIRLEGRARGPISGPDATGSLSAGDLIAAGAEIGSLRADVSGSVAGQTELHAVVGGIRVPGPSPNVLAGGPVTLDATGRLGDIDRTIRFSLRHTLFSAEGSATAARAQVHLTVPDLAPFATIAGADLKGHASFEIGATRTADAIDLSATGVVGITDGMRPVQALVGDSGTIDLAASVRGEDVKLTRLTMSGSGLEATASGQFLDRRLEVDWTLALTDLAAIRPEVSGTIAARGHVSGPPASLALTGDVTGEVASQGQHLERFTAHVSADGLPNTPEGHLTAGGTFLGAPLDVDAEAERRDESVHLVIGRANWKSLTAGGTLDLAAGALLPTGKIVLSMTRLADIAPLLGRPVAGSVTASVDASPSVARINAVVTGGALPATGSIGKAVLDATITDPAGRPALDGTLTLDGVEAGVVHASGRLTAKGAWDGLILTLAANTAELRGLPAHLDASGTLNGTDKLLSLASWRAVWGRDTIRLLAPATIAFARGVSIDRLRLGFRQGELAIAGSWNEAAGRGGSGLDLRATLLNLPADAIAIVAPEFALDGTIAGDARLTGDPARPKGAVHINASGLRMRNGSGRGLPAAASTIDATLDGASARLDAKLTAGGSNVTLTGQVPETLAGPMDLRVGGAVDLAVLGPLLQAQGRDARGRLDLAMGVGGTLAAPRASGTMRLSNCDLQDSRLGIHVTEIIGAAHADGDTFRIDRLEGKAGPGTISVAGAVTIAGTPTVDLSLWASNARVLSTDLATALIDANLTLRGAVKDNPVLAGTILARTAEVRVPEKLPPSIVVLPVREAGATPPKPPPPSAVPDIALNLTLDAPGEIYVRGRGLDAELGGRVVFAGTASRPLPLGALKLRRGTFSLAGQSLTLTEGTIDFSYSLTDPLLKLVATSGNAALTATLTISGEVRNPKIVLSSVPDLPQDEILSQLLFNTAQSRLSPLQVAQIAVALASISGVGSADDPLGGLRSKLGLDQLSVGSDASGGSSLQAGRYIAPGVRIGAAQSATGGGSQATVQIDIAKGLKLETMVGAGTAQATGGAGSSGGTGVGLMYEFEY